MIVGAFKQRLQERRDETVACARVQRVLETKLSVARVELLDGVGCSTDDEFEAGVLPLLGADLLSFVAVAARFTSRSVTALVERCGRTLQQVRLVDCRRLDVDAVKAVGRRWPNPRATTGRER